MVNVRGVGENDDIRKEIAEFTREHRAKGTNEQYKKQQENYINWCKERQIDWEKGRAEMLCKYLMHKHREGRWKSEAAFNTARSAISDMYKHEEGTTGTLGEHRLVQEVMKVIKKTAPEKKEKKAFTVEHFRQIFKHVNVNDFVMVRNYLMMLLMYAMGRRGVEATRLRKAEVVADDEKRMLIVTHTPAKQKERKRMITPIAYATENGFMDVGKWHKIYTRLREGKPESPYYFQLDTGKQMNTNTVRQAYKALFEKAGMDFTGYGAHSARVGAATAMAEAGATGEEIDEHCTWVGETRKRYVKRSTENKARATRHLDK